MGKGTSEKADATHCGNLEGEVRRKEDSPQTEADRRIFIGSCVWIHVHIRVCMYWGDVSMVYIEEKACREGAA